MAHTYTLIHPLATTHTHTNIMKTTLLIQSHQAVEDNKESRKTVKSWQE